MKSLILAEKPSVGKDIAKALNARQEKGGYIENQQYIITWAFGHLVTNADPEHYDKRYQKWALNDLPILPKYMKSILIPKSKKQFYTIKNLMHRKDVKEIIIATDAGREGELVARLIIDKAGVKKPIKRFWVSSVTPKAIKQGFKQLKDGRQYQSLYASALARSEADWIVGINATRALTTKFGAQLSLGRVQTPTIQLVKMRQDEIKHFEKRHYYTLSTQVNHQTFEYDMQKRCFDKTKLESLVEGLKGQTGTIERVTQKQKKTYPQALFSLTDLQQAAYARYKMGAKETLNTLQTLYERHKLVTYPRTDSNYLTRDMKDALKERVEALYATELKDIAKQRARTDFNGDFKCINDNKVSDHHAIVPTEIRPDMNVLSPRETKVYMLIATRFLEVLLKPYIYEETEMTLKVGQETFKFKDQIPVELGFKAIHNENLGKGFSKGGIKEGDTFKIDTLQIQQHETTPPPYFNEGTLLKAMENPQKFFDLKDKSHAKVLKETGGIGTVATRADIIDKLFNMHAIEDRSGRIYVTQKGRQILDLAPHQLTSPVLTATWEDKLVQIEKGKLKKDVFMKEMTSFTKQIVSEIKQSDATYKHDNLTTTECPTCGKFMIKIKTKNGQALVCQDPSCKTKKNVQQKTNARCPNCKKKLTRFGKGSSATYRCVCGFSETQEKMNQRLKRKGKDKVQKKDMRKYMKEEKLENNPFKDALKGLDL
ncbi:DNA topoisomerase III [Staphylococcus massiliensis]|uniref:DNA topoisomerase III n=1 Tax=Staphylococcus massiliensis TaxID=555791 RepID=UPI00370D4A8F